MWCPIMWLRSTTLLPCAREAEKYLATCYSYLPNDGDPVSNIAYLGGDEFWLSLPGRQFNGRQLERGPG